MVNYYEKKLIVGVSNAPTFCGYSKDIIEKDGLNFYKRILKRKEWNWLKEMSTEAYNVFFRFPESQRQNLEFNYDLIAETTTKERVVLHHRLVPYQLCENGNMWLGLCFVSISFFFRPSCEARIVNHQTFETYEFIDNKFILSDIKSLTSDETLLLNYLTKGMMTKEIVELLNISESTVCEKRILFLKNLA